MSLALVPWWRRIWILIRSKAAPSAVLILATVLLNGLLLAGRPDAWLDVVGAGLVVLSVALAIIMTSGVVADDFRSGMVQLWLQKPVAPARFYLARYLEAIVAASFLLILVTLLMRLGLGAMGWYGASDLLIVLPRLLLGVLLVASVSFACGAWMGGRGGVIATLAVVAAGLLVEQDLAVRTRALGEVATPLVRGFLYPESALEQVLAFTRGEETAVWVPLGRVVAYAAAGAILGMIGVRRGVTRGAIARAEDG